MTQEYEFTIGTHNEQAHEYTSALIDEAYTRKADDRPTTSCERVGKADALCEAYYVQMDDKPAEAVLSRLAWYIDFDYMTDMNGHKVSQEDYPILSDSQLRYRHRKETILSDVFTGKDDVTIGRHTDHMGVRRRIYDYMTPNRDMALVPTKYLDLYNALDNAGLTDRQRQAIELVYFEGMTQEDAAEQMGIHRANVNLYLRHGYDKIKRGMVE